MASEPSCRSRPMSRSLDHHFSAPLRRMLQRALLHHACSAATEPCSTLDHHRSRMKQAVSPDELTDAEVESYAQAVDIFRASPTSPSFFTSTPVRDEHGRLCEVRFYADNNAQRPLAVVGISDDGALLPISSLI